VEKSNIYNSRSHSNVPKPFFKFEPYGTGAVFPKKKYGSAKLFHSGGMMIFPFLTEIFFEIDNLYL